jgi:sec-independent protein translocase protein TatA
MFAQLGSTELIIILVIVIILFGAGRISRIGKEAGQAISAFKSGLQEDEEIISD